MEGVNAVADVVSAVDDARSAFAGPDLAVVAPRVDPVVVVTGPGVEPVPEAVHEPRRGGALAAIRHGPALVKDGPAGALIEHERVREAVRDVGQQSPSHGADFSQ